MKLICDGCIHVSTLHIVYNELKMKSGWRVNKCVRLVNSITLQKGSGIFFEKENEVSLKHKQCKFKKWLPCSS